MPEDAEREALLDILDHLCSSVPGVRGVLVASRDGHPILLRSRHVQDEVVLAGMAATAAGLGERLVLTLGAQELLRVSMRTPEAEVTLFMCGQKAVLVILVEEALVSPLVYLEARDAAQAVALLV